MLSIGSCGVLIYIIFFVDGPELSGFEEIDFVLKQRCEMGFFKEKLGESPRQVDIFRKLAQTKLRVMVNKQTPRTVHVRLRRLSRSDQV